MWLLASVEHVRHDSLLQLMSIVTALAGTSLLVATFALPSRVRALSTHLGIERILRSHRALAFTAVALILAHIAFVLAHSAKGFAVLDLRTAPPRVRAASVATVALVLIVLLAASRRRRRPRYEGWRLVHLLLANTVLIGTALHVYWLRDLTEHPVLMGWFAVLALLFALVSLHRWVWRPWRTRRRAYVVDEVRQDTATAVTVVLHARGHSGVPFHPGQFAWLKIGASPFVFEEHPFTIASAANEPWRKEFTIKALGDFSELLAGLRPGRTVYLDGPHGDFTVDGLASDGFVLVAGGVGITPMLSILGTLAARRDPRPVLLLVAGRTADDLLHRAHLESWKERLDLRVVEVLSEPDEGWEGEVGWLDEDVLVRSLPPATRARRRLDYFICGPAPMVAAVSRTLADQHVAVDRVHTELFDVV